MESFLNILLYFHSSNFPPCRRPEFLSITMKLSSAISILFLFSTVITALPTPGRVKSTPAKGKSKSSLSSKKPGPIIVHANVSPKTNKGTTANIKAHVKAHGSKGLTVPLSKLNSPKVADARRKDAIGHKKVPGKSIDEQPPASFRKKKDPVTTRPTSHSDSRSKFDIAMFKAKS